MPLPMTDLKARLSTVTLPSVNLPSVNLQAVPRLESPYKERVIVAAAVLGAFALGFVIGKAIKVNSVTACECGDGDCDPACCSC